MSVPHGRDGTGFAFLRASMPRALVIFIIFVFSAHPTNAASKPCQLFGNAQTRAANKNRRTELLYWTQQDELGVVIAHGSDRWQKPEAVDFAGLDLIVHEGTATVAVDRSLARRAGCSPGKYGVGVDDSIGHAAVLSVLSGGLLLELDGELRYWGFGHRCRWMMAWGSRYRMVMQVRHGVTHGKAVAPRPRRKPKAKRKRGRRR